MTEPEQDQTHDQVKKEEEEVEPSTESIEEASPKTDEALPPKEEKMERSTPGVSKEEVKKTKEPKEEDGEPPVDASQDDAEEEDLPLLLGDDVEEIKTPIKKISKAYTRYMEDRKTDWEPATRLGRMVKSGEITNMSDALRSGYPLKEPEIVDVLLPEMGDEVLDVHMVQRMTDSGRRVQFLITCVVGNENGFVGLGTAKGKEVGFTIRKAIENAKVNLIEVKRGCGSWECGCMTPHSFPFAITGKSGSVTVKFKPSPRGIGLAVGNVAKHILRLAGIKDAWVFTSGQTQTTTNYARAVFSALTKVTEMRMTPGREKDLKIQRGPIEVVE